MTPADWIMLAGRFDLGAVRGAPAYVTRGAMGEIWHLETTRGRWAAKLAGASALIGELTALESGASGSSMR